MKRCLVIGGNGFIGHHVCSSLLEIGLTVRALDIAMPKIPSAQIEHFAGSFTDPGTLDGALLGCDTVIHLGWTSLPASSNKAPAADALDNIVGSVRLLEAAQANGVRRVVFASSGGTVYGTHAGVPVDESYQTAPSCAYGISKLAVEKYLDLFHNLHGMETCSLRISNPYGEGQDPRRPHGAIAVFAHRAIHGDPIEIWGDGSVVRDFVHVKDVAAAFIAAATRREINGTYNIGSGCGTSLNQLLELIERETGNVIQRVYLPTRGFDVPVSILNIQRARTELLWAPHIDLAQGITEAVSLLKQTTY